MQPNFQSVQAYSQKKYHNDSDHPHENQDERDEFVYGYCLETVIDEPGVMCAECRMSEAERMEER